jgi:hypothetical protein
MEEPNDIDRFLTRVNQVMNDRGYLVIASTALYEVGYVIPQWRHSPETTHQYQHPMKIIELTDITDFMDQSTAIYGERFPPATGYIYFYRCITD